MHGTTTATGKPAAWRPRRPTPGVRCAAGALFGILALVPPEPPAAANNLKPVPNALVLYLGRDLMQDREELIETLGAVVSSEFLGQRPLRKLTSRQQSQVLFGQAYPNVSCTAALPGWSSRADGSAGRDRRPQLLFHDLEGYRAADAARNLCPGSRAGGTGSEPEGYVSTASLHIFDTSPQDWRHIRVSVDVALRGVPALPDEDYVVRALICPRLLQVRTPVRASVRMEPIAGDVEALIDELTAIRRNERSPRLPVRTDTVQGLPTVTFPGGRAEFPDGDQLEYNLLDVYFERALASESGNGDAERHGLGPEACAGLESSQLPDAVHAPFHLDGALRFIWTEDRDTEVPRDTNEPAPDPSAATAAQTDEGTDSPLPANVAPPGADKTALAAALDGIAAADAGHDAAVETRYVIEAYENAPGRTPDGDLAARIEESEFAVKRAEAVAALLGDDVAMVVTGFGRVRDFSAFAGMPTLMVSDDDGVSAAAPDLLKEKQDGHNRTAMVTVLRVPKAPPIEQATPWTSPRAVVSPRSALTLAGVQAAAANTCISWDEFNDSADHLDTIGAYFLGPSYEPFKELEEHRQAAILLCHGRGGAGSLTSAELGPVLLRALHAYAPRNFPADEPAIRATLLHQVGEGAARRYYLFGNSLLTHFQHGTTAGMLQYGAGDGMKPLCDEFPGLRILQGVDEPDLCERRPSNVFKVPRDTRVDRTLYHLVLPTTLAEHLACEAETISGTRTVPQATDTAPAVTEPYLILKPRPRGCPADDALPDPYKLLMDLRDRAYVFRAAIDVAYMFRHP